MPASTWATETAGILIAEGEFANSKSVDDANLLFLGDVFAIPASWPLSNVFSVGDVLLVVGAVMVLRAACAKPPSEADEEIGPVEDVRPTVV